jgi:hypothetical protein
MVGSMTRESKESTSRSRPLFRAVLGGLLGGLLSNVSGFALGVLVLHADASRFLGSMEDPPSGTRMLVEHVLMRLGIGLAAAWLYCAIRPRFERRIRAVLSAAAFLWLTTYVFSALLLEELKIYSTRAALIGTLWGLIELVLVVAAVAWVLRHEHGPGEGLPPASLTRGEAP